MPGWEKRRRAKDPEVSAVLGSWDEAGQTALAWVGRMLLTFHVGEAKGTVWITCVATQVGAGHSCVPWPAHWWCLWGQRRLRPAQGQLWCPTGSRRQEVTDAASAKCQAFVHSLEELTESP